MKVKCPLCSQENQIEEVTENFYFNKVKYRCIKCESIWTFTDYTYTEAKKGLIELLNAEKKHRIKSPVL